MKDSENTICLNMIVKNESKVIKRCLKSVKKLIDYWVIVDTGSTDNTKEILKEFMKEIPGELYEREWKNFAYNRNEALELAKNKGDYLLIIDADEELVFEKDFILPNLEKDLYCIVSNFNGRKHTRKSLVYSMLNWKWRGVVHEIIESDEQRTCSVLKGVENIYRKEGCRSQDPNTYYKDIQLLLEELEKNPKDERSVFYLAQSYLDAKHYDKAIEFYKKRSEMTGFDDEVYLSYFLIGKIALHKKKDPQTFIRNMYKAYSCSPNRAEPLYCLANYYRKQGMFSEAYTLATLGLRIPCPSNFIEIEFWVYEYGMLYESFESAFALKRYVDVLLTYARLLNIPDLPVEIKEKINEKIKPLEADIFSGKIKGIKAKIGETIKVS